MDTVKIVFAVIVSLAFAAFAAFLVVNADTTNQTEWERWVYVFGAAEAIAFAAVGWMFGKEVNRERAENAEATAKEATAEANQSKETGAKLAGMVIGGSGGQTGLEAMGEGGGGLKEAVDFARSAYPDA